MICLNDNDVITLDRNGVVRYGPHYLYQQDAGSFFDDHKIAYDASTHTATVYRNGEELRKVKIGW